MKFLTEMILNLLYPSHCPVCHGILKKQNTLICPQCLKLLHSVTGSRCLKCSKPVAEDTEFCKECSDRERHFTEGVGILLYDPVVRKSLLRYKYSGCREYGDFYALFLCRSAEKWIRRWKPDLIVPVPMYWRKKRLRGFNQAEYLAERIGDYYGIPTAKNLVKKVQNTKSQKKLDADRRRKNLKKAFCVSGRLDGYKILIVDDVYTTGSTVDMLSECLKEKGADKVYFLTVALGDSR